MNKPKAETRLNADTFLSGLTERGIKYVFANAGTDFAPVIESLVIANESGREVPEFLTVPHENVAVSMAHGYYRRGGEMAAVMVHVNVGTANAICGVQNAARDNVPILLAAGRTPYTEEGHHGSRLGNIHWGQECFDQGGLLREFVKWDYELRAGQPAGTLVGRALDIAMTEPRGPVYLNLPREVLGDPAKSHNPPHRDRDLGVEPQVASSDAIDRAADMLINADNPLILTTAAGRDPAAVPLLAELADTYAIPVAQPFARDMNMASDHPMNMGTMAGELIEEADVILTIDCEVPWQPSRIKPSPSAKLIHMAPDPLFSRYPFRGFETDIALAGNTAPSLALLLVAMSGKTKGKKQKIDKRRKAVQSVRAERDAKRKKLLEQNKASMPIHGAWLATCINQVKSADTMIVNELGVPFDFIEMTEPRTYMAASAAGGLGVGLGAALGGKLAKRDSNVIAVVGDGSYMFGCPTPAHYVATAEKLPTLTIVANNHRWNAVHASTLAMYPDGRTSKSNAVPLVSLDPSPAFETTIQACGGYGEKVEDPAELPKALERAMDKVEQGVPALLNVLTSAVPGSR